MRRMSTWPTAFALLLGVTGAFAAPMLCAAAAAEKTSPAPAPLASRLAVIPLVGDIDYGLLKSVERRVSLALADGAEVIVFEMDSYGGGLGPGHEIGDYINNISSTGRRKVKTVAYVRKKAISAGALISLACREIVMRKGTTIGDCQAIQVNPQTRTMQEAPEKVQSLVRALMRTYAESNGYPELLCVAMVDPDIEVKQVTFTVGDKQPGKTEVKYLTPKQVEELSEAEKKRVAKNISILAAGKLLTMTDVQAREYGFSRASVDGHDDVIRRYAASSAEIKTYATNWSEEMVRFLNSMAVASVLLTAGMVALYVAVKTPGFGVPEIVALSCFAVFFLSKYLVDLAAYWEILLFLVGIALLYVEIFVTPGFGVVGVSGIACIFVSLILALQKFVLPSPSLPWTVDEFAANLLSVFGSILISIALMLLLLRYLPRSSIFSPLILKTAEAVEAGYVVGSAGQRDLVGRPGLAVTTLRPSGRAVIDGKTLLVVADGEFIESGSEVVVAEVRGNRVVVRKA